MLPHGVRGIQRISRKGGVQVVDRARKACRTRARPAHPISRATFQKGRHAPNAFAGPERLISRSPDLPETGGNRPSACRKSSIGCCTSGRADTPADVRPARSGLLYLIGPVHATNSPFQTAALAGTAFEQWSRLARTAMGAEAAIMPKPDDRRFVAPAWQHYPYNFLTQAVLLGEEWWDSVVQSPSGVGRPNTRIVAFNVRQWLDAVLRPMFPGLIPR